MIELRSISIYQYTIFEANTHREPLSLCSCSFRLVSVRFVSILKSEISPSVLTRFSVLAPDLPYQPGGRGRRFDPHGASALTVHSRNVQSDPAHIPSILWRDWQGGPLLFTDVLEGQRVTLELYIGAYMVLYRSVTKNC